MIYVINTSASAWGRNVWVALDLPALKSNYSPVIVTRSGRVKFMSGYVEEDLDGELTYYETEPPWRSVTTPNRSITVVFGT